jgi:hypothetical protein
LKISAKTISSDMKKSLVDHEKSETKAKSSKQMIAKACAK